MKTRIGKLSLRTRLLLIILLASLPAAGFFALESSRQYKRAYHDAGATLMAIARLAASNQTQVIQGVKDTLLAISEQTFVRRQDRASCRSYLTRLKDRYPAYNNFVLIESNGDVVCSGTPPPQPVNVSDRSYFQTLVQEKRFVSGGYLAHRFTGAPLATFALPLMEDGKLVGAIATALRMEAFSSLAHDVPLPAGASFLISDAYGNVLARQPALPEIIGKSLPDAGMREGLGVRSPQFLEAQGMDGVHRLYAVVPSLYDGKPAFYIFVGIDQAKLANTAKLSLKKNLAVLSMIVLLSIAGTWFLSRRFLISPMRRVIRAAKDVRAGNLKTRTGIDHDTGEIGELAMHFDAMTHALEEREQASQAAQQYIEYLAQHDPLTNLPNRRLLDICLAQLIEQMTTEGKPLIVLFLNLDRFRLINDSMGQVVGDQLLQTVAKRLEFGVPVDASVAHLGSDEFVCVVPGVGRKELSSVARALVSRVTEPFFINGERIEIGTTVGAAIFPEHSDDGTALVRHAEVAMHEAKESRMPIRVFSPHLGAAAGRRRVLETDLRRALANHEFLLAYQPKVDAGSRRIVGAEALIRWQHPEKGLLSPAGYIHLAEEIQLIVPLGEWALRAACFQNKLWQDAGLPPIQVAVNVSAHQFKREDFVETVQRALDDSGLEARYLELEITEGALLQGSHDVLHALRGMGIVLAIDDFGTGYSNLSYLKDLPVDKLKIDQSFIRDIVRDPSDAAVAQAIINVAKSLRMKVVAEGVEDRQTFDILEGLHCDEIQGYYCGRPQLPDEFIQLLRQGFAMPEEDIHIIRAKE
ncbi:diguanylate cyclase (GGDEF)-like protein [Paucimonas lemoignei]|uniref:Diguanylate cyclase (GGDEF)-like protein n=1 Tax=Paucimonas lemoignei TaxID=29443 RepID=A0A4R3HU34_PAULE|nr:EAL domain-containing protein [Paucimonas lemoignei]TCS35173.1 diguanylate cyclase (GGDEF)-like protein [Paucimonas lemoignei]